MSNLRIESLGNLSGLVAVVTGGGTGLGFIMAKAFADNGAKVYITGRRKDKLETAASVEIQGPGSILPLPMDVLSKDSIRSAINAVAETDGKLDILVNNAGIAPALTPFMHDHSSDGTATMGQRLFESDSEKWAATFASNTTAPFFVTNGFLELLLKGARARPGETSSVINISSSFAQTNLSMDNLAYSASKVAVEQVTKSLATEYALHKIPIRVNAIAPGTFASELVGTEESLKEASYHPIPGALLPAPVLRPGREEEFAMTAIYLASKAGGFTNGHVLVMDGGWNIINP